MAKPNRGKELKRNSPGAWRGTCPKCSRKRVRKIWSAVLAEGGEPISVCKHCR